MKFSNADVKTKAKLQNLKSFFIYLVLFIILLSPAQSQFKYSVNFGAGFALPDFTEFNTAISDSGLDKLGSIWLPTTFDFSYKLYPSFRVGLFRHSNSLIKNKSSQDFSLVIKFTGIYAQSFFTFSKRFEAFFGLAPMIGKADFSQTPTKIQATTTPFQFTINSEAGMYKRFFAFYAMGGVRFYLLSFLALEGSVGYLNAFFSDGNWKSDGNDINFKSKIDLDKPVMNFGIVLGW